jgi:(p)ppGpp synthase/HD superfamily hydrolase
MEYDLRLVMDFAFKAHEGQVRKYVPMHYIVHPLTVYGLVRSVGCDTLTQAGALLHDVIEDTDETYANIATAFDLKLADLVMELTDTIYTGNRKERQRQIRASWHDKSDRARSIRLADTLHNIESIVCHDRDFALVYLAEKYALLPHLQGGDIQLYTTCAQRLTELLFQLGKNDGY